MSIFPNIHPCVCMCFQPLKTATRRSCCFGMHAGLGYLILECFAHQARQAGQPSPDCHTGHCGHHRLHTHPSLCAEGAGSCTQPKAECMGGPHLCGGWTLHTALLLAAVEHPAATSLCACPIHTMHAMHVSPRGALSGPGCGTVCGRSNHCTMRLRLRMLPM
jgi:hypothetical protein